MSDGTTNAIEQALALATLARVELPKLTKAMRALANGIYFVRDLEKDERRDAYVALRDSAVAQYRYAPAAATDPWIWDDYLAAFEERNGYLYRGCGSGITSAMAHCYLEDFDTCD